MLVYKGFRAWPVVGEAAIGDTPTARTLSACPTPGRRTQWLLPRCQAALATRRRPRQPGPRRIVYHSDAIAARAIKWRRASGAGAALPERRGGGHSRKADSSRMRPLTWGRAARRINVSRFLRRRRRPRLARGAVPQRRRSWQARDGRDGQSWSGAGRPVHGMHFRARGPDSAAGQAVARPAGDV